MYQQCIPSYANMVCIYVHRICSIVHFSPENSETQTPYQIFIEAIHIRVHVHKVYF